MAEKIIDDIKKICTFTAEAHGCEGNVKATWSAIPVHNHDDQVDIAHEACADLIGENNVLEGIPLMGSEDFAFYVDKIPGAFISLNTVEPNEDAVI